MFGRVIKFDIAKGLVLIFLLMIVKVDVTNTAKNLQQKVQQVQTQNIPDTISTASSTANSLSIGSQDLTSTSGGGVTSQATSTATALNGGQANSDALSNSLGAALAQQNGHATANSDSSAASDASTLGGSSKSAAVANSAALSTATGDSQTTVDSKSNVNSSSTSVGDGRAYYLGNPVVTWKDNLAADGPLMGNQKRQNNEMTTLVEALNNEDRNQIATNDYVDWEVVYNNQSTDKYHKKKYVNVHLINANYEDSTYLPDLSLPVQMESSRIQANQSPGAKINWTYTQFVGIDVALDFQGNAIAAGLDGAVYERDAIEETWSKMPGDIEMGSVLRVAMGFDSTPYAVMSSGETYYQTCERKWQLLPGCARDIATGPGGEVYKVGCERRTGGYRLYKLVCKYDCEKCAQCFRWRKKSSYTFEGDSKKCQWFNIHGGAVRVAVHPNGHPFIVNDRAEIQYYDGNNFVTIPNTSALDLDVSSEGIVYFVGTDYAVYSLYPYKYESDYTKATKRKLIGEAAIAVTAKCYGLPMIVGDGYKVHESANLGFKVTNNE